MISNREYRIPMWYGVKSIAQNPGLGGLMRSPATWALPANQNWFSSSWAAYKYRMRIQTLLEYDRARAIQALGPNLWKALLKDQQGLTMLDLDELEAYGEKYADSPRGKNVKRVFASPELQNTYADDALQVIEDADPSTNKKYTQWMARQFVNGSEAKLEDVTSTLADYVDKFNRLNLKRKLPAG